MELYKWYILLFTGIDSLLILNLMMQDKMDQTKNNCRKAGL